MVLCMEIKNRRGGQPMAYVLKWHRQFLMWYKVNHGGGRQHSGRSGKEQKAEHRIGHRAQDREQKTEQWIGQRMGSVVLMGSQGLICGMPAIKVTPSSGEKNRIHRMSLLNITLKRQILLPHSLVIWYLPCYYCTLSNHHCKGRLGFLSTRVQLISLSLKSFHWLLELFLSLLLSCWTHTLLVNLQHTNWVRQK